MNTDRETICAGLRRPIAALLSLSLGLGLAGCETDSFLDPSTTGRWEHTPTSVPILDRIASIEGEADQFVELSDVQPSDLIPELTDYRVAPGDGLSVEIFDLIQENVPQIYPVTVDTRGNITIPILGQIYVDGLTQSEIQQVVASAMADLVADPIVTVTIAAPRQTTYSVIGGTIGAGSFFIPTADFRLLEALTNTQGLDPRLDEIYIIRQTPLTREVAGETGGLGSAPAGLPADRSPVEGEALIDLLDDLAGDDDDGGMGVLAAQGGQPEPEIDLIDAQDSGAPDTGGWVFVDGRWTKVSGSRAPGADAAEDPLGRLMTQRVIRVPVAALLAGDTRYNVVVRPGDIIRIPPADFGNIYLSGFVNTPGVYGLVPGLTLTRAITAARGLSGVAIPERVDLTRMVGNDRQATIRLNLRAIENGTEPDIYLKDNDRINVGTNFWATPLAVTRSGFRFSYGFGFLIDRNFGPDVFGAVPLDNN
ncbi:MAG: polysaccharide biosynthesis/export family protein [Planctomycetota bacterium]